MVSVDKRRVAVAKAKVHASIQAGICGNPQEGAYSVVVSGGYEDDVDHGDTMYAHLVSLKAGLYDSYHFRSVYTGAGMF